MSDAKQPEQMRPIPDGGLKDAMPSWLKRPPAWRDLPTAVQRHERNLPEPDTSEIDPRSLVDVSDLPQWLQAIAARGEIPVPAPDASVDHAVEVVQAAKRAASAQPEPVNEMPEDPDSSAALEDASRPPVGQGAMPGLEDDSGVTPIAETTPFDAGEPAAPAPVPSDPGNSSMPIWILPVAALVIIALLVTIVVLL